MRIRYVNPLGRELILDSWPKNPAQYILQNWEGFGEVPVSLQTRKAPYQDGVTVMEQLLEPRHLSLEIVILGDNKQEVYNKRRFLQSLFNPKPGAGRLEWYHPNGKVYSIEVIPDGTPAFPGGEARTNRSQLATVDLMAPNPVWENVVTMKLKLFSLVSLFAFPLRLPTQMGVKGDRRVVCNEGDVATPVRIVFHGPAVNPTVTNETTGQYIRVKQELLHGERLVINTTFGAKSVVLQNSNGEQTNAFRYIDLGSELWQLVPGKNVLSYSADVGADEAVVEVYYREWYVGV